MMERETSSINGACGVLCWRHEFAQRERGSGPRMFRRASCSLTQHQRRRLAPNATGASSRCADQAFQETRRRCRRDRPSPRTVPEGPREKAGDWPAYHIPAQVRRRRYVKRIDPTRADWSITLGLPAEPPHIMSKQERCASSWFGVCGRSSVQRATPQFSRVPRDTLGLRFGFLHSQSPPRSATPSNTGGAAVGSFPRLMACIAPDRSTPGPAGNKRRPQCCVPSHRRT
jgi:hypothetical protein